MTDVIVVGGGVIGLSIAHELAGQGVSVAVFEQGQFGREASWAGAGILPPGKARHADTPEAQLRGVSHRLWPRLSEELREETGIDNGFRNCGGIVVAMPGESDRLSVEAAERRHQGVRVEDLTREQLGKLEPALSREITAAYRLPEMSQVRNPRHLKALVAGCAARGVELRPGWPVVGFKRKGETVLAVGTADGSHAAGQVCVAGGAWSRRLLSDVGFDLPVVPVRGQIVMLSTDQLPFRHVIEVGKRYLVPRPDGRILIGSTEERVGFDKRNTAEAVAELIRFGTQIVPSLSHARFERAWSGLRPGSPDGLPFLGHVPGLKNLYVAAGHFRAGLQLSPGTAQFVCSLMLGRESFLPAEAFAVDRAPLTPPQSR